MSNDDKLHEFLSKSEAEFALKLLHQQDHSQSFVFSPIAISLALYSLYEAARGETRSQIHDCLFKNATDGEMVTHFSNVSTALSAMKKDPQVKICNHIICRNGIKTESLCLDKVKLLYNCEVSSHDLDNEKETIKTINKLIRENTDGHIKKINTKISIDKDQVVVFLSAACFEAQWQNKFHKLSTSKKEFFCTANSHRNIKFLHATGANRKYCENDKFQVLSLPYTDSSFEMTIFLPKEQFGLAEALKTLGTSTIQELKSNVSNYLVNVQIPIWRNETEIDLNSTLQAIGITKILNESAYIGNFAENVHISEFIHKAIIEVNENGTSPATNTKVITKRWREETGEIRDFIADHPFLYTIHYKNSILFMGVFAG
ncbi:Serpin domain-containing protein [Caenorhabditis elegans]|uniref:Serpin domain-containing protein n=2 Tax=Caenorhabditis elegans TaxID=6239 RepID=Q19651_CAEEL|nr:Serpin domain-containing protein [Caenorhabditis elegans]CCD68320.2 Serpin domain-containing protein [Caenorhabditis elegans]|eukprot:NP_001309497.1 SeRPin [Caenorhabditis elegans]